MFFSSFKWPTSATIVFCIKDGIPRPEKSALVSKSRARPVMPKNFFACSPQKRRSHCDTFSVGQSFTSSFQKGSRVIDSDTVRAGVEMGGASEEEMGVGWTVVVLGGLDDEDDTSDCSVSPTETNERISFESTQNDKETKRDKRTRRRKEEGSHQGVGVLR